MLSLLTFDRPCWCVSLSFLCKQIEANCVFVNADLVEAHFTATKSEIFIFSLSRTRTNRYLMSNPPEMRKIQQINSAVSRPMVVYRSGNINDTLQLRSPGLASLYNWLGLAGSEGNQNAGLLHFDQPVSTRHSTALWRKC